MSDRLEVYKYTNTDPKGMSDTALRADALAEANRLHPKAKITDPDWYVRAVDWNVEVLLGYRQDRNGNDDLSKPILANHCYVWLQRGELQFISKRRAELENASDKGDAQL